MKLGQIAFANDQKIKKSILNNKIPSVPFKKESENVSNIFKTIEGTESDKCINVESQKRLQVGTVSNRNIV